MHSNTENLSIVVNGINMFYSETGKDNKQTVVFIHGFPFNRSMWNDQLEFLKDDYHVVSIDVRGHGESEAGNEDFSIDLFVDDLIAFMDDLNLDKVVLCGLSMGGYIALLAMQEYPERFNGLILCDTQCVADTPENVEKRMKTIENVKLNGIRQYAKESIKNLFTAESLETKKEHVTKIEQMIVSTSKQSIIKTLQALAKREATCERLDEINVPVLIIVGAEDKITPLDKAEMLHEKVKNSTLEIIQAAAHVSNMEQPDEFNAKLRDFLLKL